MTVEKLRSQFHFFHIFSSSRGIRHTMTKHTEDDGEPKSTLNRMQEELHEGAEAVSHVLEWPIFPGPQILEWRKVVPNSLTILAVWVSP